MAWFRKRPDPISDRERALTDEIAALEVEISQLDAQLQQDHLQPRLRSAAVPRGASIPHAEAPEPSVSAPPAVHEPIFEEVRRDRLEGHSETPTTPEHYNELGVRKYDLPALLRRLRNHFRGPATTNPKLVSYLAAGGIQGLRPLRYEKRVARNRFIWLAILLFAILLGLIAVYIHH